jgi:K+-sensing histidine kinase KdpD
MENLLVIIFVFIMNFLTYFLPQIVAIIMVFSLVGFFVSMIINRGESKNTKSERKKEETDKYMQFGQFMEEDDKRRGGGSWK